MSDEPEEGGIDFGKFFDQLRKSASVKAGAIMFGQAQVAYYDSLKQGGLDEEAAFNMVAHVSECIIKATPGFLKVMLEAALAWDTLTKAIADREALFGKSDKEVP